eukprot:199698-Pleurochrysis_carterae.AAC.1
MQLCHQWSLLYSHSMPRLLLHFVAVSRLACSHRRRRNSPALSVPGGQNDDSSRPPQHPATPERCLPAAARQRWRR